MSARSVASTVALLASIASATAAVGGCSAREVDVVHAGPALAPTATALIWPNETSTANSDPWIVAHHDAITEMHPRVLVLQFYNGIDVSQTTQIAESQIDAIAEGSRYHGYADSSAPTFLSYDLVGVVDLSDHPPPADWTNPSSTLLPVDSTGAFDTATLFDPSFAPHYGFPDPSNPSRDLTLCELFENGVINELWLEVGEGGPRAPGLMMESKQVYDASGDAVPGDFNACTGYACLDAPPCKVTARIAHLSPTRGLGCDLVARSTGVENMRLALPYMEDNGIDFFDGNFEATDGTRFDSWADLCAGTTGDCITYPSETEATGTYSDGSTWTMDPFVQGCGTSHFPPNARYEWDYTNTQPVRSRCEHYGMHDGPSGGDQPDAYSSDKLSAYTSRYGTDCGGGWQVYYRQNMPGWNNAAHAADGTPMKNWWPFLFY